MTVVCSPLYLRKTSCGWHDLSHKEEGTCFYKVTSGNQGAQSHESCTTGVSIYRCPNPVTAGSQIRACVHSCVNLSCMRIYNLLGLHILKKAALHSYIMKNRGLFGMTKQAPKIYPTNEKKRVNLMLQSLKVMQEASHRLACAEEALIAFEGSRKVCLLQCAVCETCLCS